MLSPKYIHQILEQGGSYVVLPGRTKNTLELVSIQGEIDSAHAHLYRRFALAEVVHFGDPEKLREQIIDRVSLNKGEGSL
jgi:hypothetical protein